MGGARAEHRVSVSNREAFMGNTKPAKPGPESFLVLINNCRPGFLVQSRTNSQLLIKINRPHGQTAALLAEASQNQTDLQPGVSAGEQPCLSQPMGPSQTQPPRAWAWRAHRAEVGGCHS